MTNRWKLGNSHIAWFLLFAQSLPHQPFTDSVICESEGGEGFKGKPTQYWGMKKAHVVMGKRSWKIWGVLTVVFQRWFRLSVNYSSGKDRRFTHLERSSRRPRSSCKAWFCLDCWLVCEISGIPHWCVSVWPCAGQVGSSWAICELSLALGLK